MWIGRRGPFYFLVHGSERGHRDRTGAARDAVLAWKKAHNRGKAGTMPDTSAFTRFLDERGGAEFDLIAVPPPSFHQWSAYPAQMLCERALQPLGLTLTRLWPQRHDKTGKVWTANIRKTYPPPAEPVAGKLVLILDDIATSGNTMAAAMRSVVRAGGYPAGCVYA